MQIDSSNEKCLYPFEIISEEASSKDIFQNQVHQRLADSLSRTIHSNKKGITIGLEGDYGSGKSTILKLFKDKIGGDEKSDVQIFYFDTWEHEGDPLKRVFLEELINQCFEVKDDKINDLKDEISGRSQSRDIEIKRSTTRFGFYMAIATLLIPIGGSVLSIIDKTNLTFENTGEINYSALIGFTLITSPFIVIFLNLIVLFLQACFTKFKFYQIINWVNWAFLKSNSHETVKEKTFDSAEKTSVEFKEYFDRILQEFQNRRTRKLVIILDNIDRVQPADNFKLVNILQNYLKDDSGLLKARKSLEKVYTIIPYDVNGINKRISNKNENGLISFLDKNLRVRFRIPRITYRDWKNTLDEYFIKKLEGWPESDIEIASKVFKNINPDTAFSPTPRQINIYLNQLGILRNHFSSDLISTEILCYYIFKTTISLQDESSNEKPQKSNIFDIQQLLIDGKVPTEYEEYVLNTRTIKEELAAILFDSLTKEDAYTILLETPIRQSLLNTLPKATKKLEETHKDNFWNVLNTILLSSKPIDFFNFIGGIYNFNISTGFDKSRLKISNKIAKFIDIDSENILGKISPSSDGVARSITGLIFFSDDHNGEIVWLNTLKVVLIQGCSSQGSDTEIRKRILLVDEIFRNIKNIAKFKPNGIMVSSLDFNLGIYAKILFYEDFKLVDLIEIDIEKTTLIMRKLFDEANYLYLLIYLYEKSAIGVEEIKEVILNNYLRISIDKPIEHIGTQLSSNMVNLKFTFTEYIDFLYYLTSKLISVNLKGYLDDPKSPLNYYKIEILDEYVFKIALIRIQVLKGKARFYKSGTSDELVGFSLFDDPTDEFINFFKRHILKFKLQNMFWELGNTTDFKFLYHTLISDMYNEENILSYNGINLLDYHTGVQLIHKFKEDRSLLESELGEFTKWFIKIGDYNTKNEKEIEKEFKTIRSKYVKTQYPKEVINSIDEQNNFFKEIWSNKETKS